MIAAYLDTLAGALGFDPALARRVRQEAEDHLRQAVAADPAGEGSEAERRAIARFGDPHAIARRFAPVALARLTRRSTVTLIVLIAGMFAAMKGRIAWYAAVQWTITGDLRGIAETIAAIDRAAFWISVLVAGACALMAMRLRPTGSVARSHLRLFLGLFVVAAAALAVSVIGDTLLLALRMYPAEWSVRVLLPVVTVALEVAGVLGLAVHMHRMVRRTAAAAAILAGRP